jgi:protein-disulfide isomerase
LIRPFARFFSAAALIAFSLPLFQASAQTKAPSAPAPAQPAAQASGQTNIPPVPAEVPSAPAPTTPSFPKPNPADFTASAPTPEVVNAFLQATWGYDENRVWQVQAILKTQVEGISKVIVYVADKTGKLHPQVLIFYALPDGKHIVVNDRAGLEITPFGEHPFAAARAELEQRADGPYRGSASKDLELVEFADFQCPHCKDAQANMDKLVADFPHARIVFESDPIAALHPEAMRAAEYGVCVDKMGGSTAFFQYASAVFEGQDGLSTPDGATLTLNSATTKAGLDPAKVAACAATPATKAEVEASAKLGADLNVESVPTLMVNGRDVPIDIPYDMLKKIVLFQAKLDGMAAD